MAGYKYRDPERGKTTFANVVFAHHDMHINLWMKYIDQLYETHPSKWTMAETLMVHHFRTWLVKQSQDMRREEYCNGYAHRRFY